MGSRWAGLAVRAHNAGVIDYSETPRLGTWKLKERLLFDALEGQLLSDMHEMLHMEHITVSGDVAAESFQGELDSAKARYNSCGSLRLPWLKWKRSKTAAEAYGEAMERRKDPAHRAQLRRMQDELEADTEKIASAVKSELSLAKDVREARAKQKKQMQELKRRQKRARLSRRRRPGSAKRRAR